MVPQNVTSDVLVRDVRKDLDGIVAMYALTPVEAEDFNDRVPFLLPRILSAVTLRLW